MIKQIITLIVFSLGIVGILKAQVTPDDVGLRAIGTPANPKVKWNWNYYMDYSQYMQLAQELSKAYPNLVKLESIGKSSQGMDMVVLKITDYKTGDSNRKPGFWIDGGIHANELQGTQFAMYTAWYLAESFDQMDFVKEMLKDRIFYILPSLSPDSREAFLYKPNTANSSRTGQVALDDDGDGYVNEDDYDDLDGDGSITMMRQKSPTGRYKQDPEYPERMVRAKADEAGEYEMLGREGIDNDGDGRINEDQPGRYDPNRDWGWGWQPDYVQRGAFYYPGSLIETRNVKDFIYAHPNIAGAQSYHNYGGMFLRGPGAKEDAKFYSRSDIAVYDVIGKQGEKMIPGYNYYVLWKDLYTVYGGEIDWLSLARGIFTFSNEINTSYRLFNEKRSEGRFQNTEFNEFNKYLLMNDSYVAWKPYKHPQYGDIEIGGPKKNYIRNTPGFMLEEEGHRNMAFTLLHAFHMPKLEIASIDSKSLGNGLTEVTATVINTRAMPTHSSHDIKYKVERPDYITLKNANVISGMLIQNEDLNLATEQKHNPEKIEVANIPGTVGSWNYGVKVKWIIRGSKNSYTVEVDSMKGGVITRTE